MNANHCEPYIPSPLHPLSPTPRSSNPKKGPWRVTLNANHCEPYMAYCTNRMKRFELWHALNNRSSIKDDEKNLSNHLIIKVTWDDVIMLSSRSFAVISLLDHFVLYNHVIIKVTWDYVIMLSSRSFAVISLLRSFRVIQPFDHQGHLG